MYVALISAVSSELLARPAVPYAQSSYRPPIGSFDDVERSLRKENGVRSKVERSPGRRLVSPTRLVKDLRSANEC